MKILTDTTVGTIQLGDRTLRRLGFGAMRISSARNAEGVRDREEARRLCRRLVERGVQFIDTANIYGYGESEEILAEALQPFAKDLLIATKSGYRPGKILPGHQTLPALGHPDHISEDGIVFLPWAPIFIRSPKADAAISNIAKRHRASPQQVALRWLLHRSPTLLPIPGTSRMTHLDENIDAAWLGLTPDDLAEIDALGEF
jgi:aryl-alcohol dehydrogenase-like predicted oxidoreductase